MPTARISASTGPIDLYYEETGRFDQHVAEFRAADDGGRWGTWKRAAR